MLLRGLATALAVTVLAQLDPPRKRGANARAAGRWGRWIYEPRSAVLLVLASVLLGGGARKLLRGWRARGAIGLLEEPDVSPEAIRQAAAHGRAGVFELFRVLGSAKTEAQREAAGRALATLWARDEMIAEEEKAVVRRGFHVDWKARRVYPRALRAPIPVAVHFGVPFLSDNGDGVGPTNLEWSHRVIGSRRASLEVFGPWVAGEGVARFDLVPADFETDGPHQLVLHARVRTVGLTGSWESDLPHMPFRFEFDPRLAVDALYALPDDSRASAFSRGVRLSGGEPAEDEVPTFLPLNEGLSVRGSPGIEVMIPLPCDLAHSVALEFEGVPGTFPAGTLVVNEANASGTSGGVLRRTLGPVSVPTIDRPGRYKVRARLTPDPDLGWADPGVRSIWPGMIETDWIGVEVVRR